MIGYDPNGLMIHMAHKQEVGDILIGTRDPAANAKLVAELQKEAEKVILEKTGIKVGSKARVCVSGGLSLIGGMRPMHNHDDPRQHVIVEVIRIDHWGEIHYRDERGAEETTYMGMITLAD